MVAAVHVSVTGNNSLLTLVTPPVVVAECVGGGTGGGQLLFTALDNLEEAFCLEEFQVPICTRGTGFFFLGGKLWTLCTQDSSLEAFLMRSKSTGCLLGLVLMACASILSMKAATLMSA